MGHFFARVHFCTRSIEKMSRVTAGFFAVQICVDQARSFDFPNRTGFGNLAQKLTQKLFQRQAFALQLSSACKMSATDSIGAKKYRTEFFKNPAR